MALPRINEFVFNHTGSDSNEFIEIFGDPNTDLSAYSILVIEGDSGGAGEIRRVFPLGTTDADGFWTTGILSGQLQNGTQTVLLVEGFTGSVGDDLDAGNDGTLDSAPWTSIIDSVAVDDGGGTDQTYASTVLDRGFDGNANTVGGASLIASGPNPGDPLVWVRNDFEGAGLPAFPGVVADADEAVNTPGAANAVAAPAPPSIVINEIDSDTPSFDNAEFIELFDGGSGNTSLDGLVLVFFNGGVGNQSYLTIDLTGFSTDANGYFVIGDPSVNPDLAFGTGVNTSDIQNGPDAVALYAGSASDFPDGTVATTANLIDAVAYDTNDADDIDLLTALGLSVQINEDELGDKDTDSIGRDPNGTGDFAVLDSPTPGAANEPVPPPPPPEGIVINEIDADMPGNDTAEFVELFDGGVGNTALDGLTLVFFNGNGDTAYEAFDLDGFTTDADGYFLLGNAGLNPDFTISNATLQNGPDAVALYAGNALRFRGRNRGDNRQPDRCDRLRHERCRRCRPACGLGPDHPVQRHFDHVDRARPERRWRVRDKDPADAGL